MTFGLWHHDLLASPIWPLVFVESMRLEIVASFCFELALLGLLARPPICIELLELEGIASWWSDSVLPDLPAGCQKIRRNLTWHSNFDTTICLPARYSLSCLWWNIELEESSSSWLDFVLLDLPADSSTMSKIKFDMTFELWRYNLLFLGLILHW